MTKQSRRNWKKTLVDYSFVTPFMILFTLFTVLPVVVAILLSFTYFNMMEMPHVVWLENYINLFLNDSLFIKALQNTLIIAAITGPLGYVFSFVTAWVLNELPRGVRTVGTLVFYAPTLSGNMVAIWLMLFSGDANGYLNSFLMRLGMISNPIQFLRNPQYMLPVLVIIVLWSSLGAGFLSFVAGIQGVDRSLYEAASVDGITNRWQELWYITLPSMRPQQMFGAVMSITSSLGVGAVITQVFGFPSYDYTLHTIATHLDDFGGTRFEMGYACAIATILFGLMVGLNMIIKKWLARIGE
ncbi:MAG: sugar ABC transporter permease [Clostridia bacterium]|nr:sugar ABC transporter permease [Clostridia bacterium]